MNNTWAPEPITTWLEGMERNGKSQRYFERADRFAEYAAESFEAQEELRQAWASLEKCAASSDDLVSLFITLPDKPDTQPFAHMFGGRKTCKEIEDRPAVYKEALAHIQAVESFIDPHTNTFRNLLRDASARTDSLSACGQFRSIERELQTGLAKLRALLELTDISAQFPTEHYKTGGAALKNYAILIAELNRYLTKASWAALATIAKINYPDAAIEPDQLRKAWGRMNKPWADKQD